MRLSIFVFYNAIPYHTTTYLYFYLYPISFEVMASGVMWYFVFVRK